MTSVAGRGSESAAYEVKLDPELARDLVERGGSLLLLDVPPGTSIGVDHQMFVVGERFKGVKMMPPGPHFIYYSTPSKYGADSSPIVGFFVHLAPSEVIVRRWNVQEEALQRLPDPSDEERFAEGVRRMEFDASLGAYDIHHYKIWQHLSQYITPNVIQRHAPVGGDISVMAEAEASENIPQTAAERDLDAHLKEGQQWARARLSAAAKGRAPGGIPAEVSGAGRGLGTADADVEMPGISGSQVSVPGGSDESSGRCFYTHLPRLIKQSGATGANLTAINLDKSAVLEHVLKTEYGSHEEALLGELQFCFVAFLMGQSLESFGQWKSIVHLLGGCQVAPLRSRTRLFVKFLDVLYHQLHHGLGPQPNADLARAMPAQHSMPLMEDTWIVEDLFLRTLFTNFFSDLREAGDIDTELYHKAMRLKKLLESTLGWTLERPSDTAGIMEDEDDEYAPVVVTDMATQMEYL